LSSHELQELLDEEVQNILLAATQDGVDAARFDEDERSDSEVVNLGFPRHESTSYHDIPVHVGGIYKIMLIFELC
jgi:hypothetical protein